jgi:hypothetical protein
VAKNGQRFLVNLSAEDEHAAPITVVMNWDAAQRKSAAAAVAAFTISR